MKHTKVKQFLALGLTLVLALPSFQQWTHLIHSHHQETICVNNNLHFHQQAQDCSLEYTFTSPHILTGIYSSTPDAPRTLLQAIHKKEFLYPFLPTNFYFLRGPPPFIAI